jgi:pentose-5-phosphate-3-epimerase
VQVVNAGASMLVVGTTVFNHPHSIQEGMTALRRSLNLSQQD